MKQVININFQGRVVPIEVTAFEILKAYTESLNRYFSNEEGKEEIINDIESRIGELFQERLKEGSTCITDEDVNAIIKSMGRPEDFETEETNATASEKKSEQQSEQSSSSTSSSSAFSTAGMPKRLYRDENDKVIGGVCSGLANYFGIDVVVMRIIFVVLAVSFGVGLIPYLILWVAVPSTASAEIGGVRKKLYRDSDNKIVAGVCSGIGNYFGINAWIPRVLFLLPFLSFFSRWNHWGDFDFQNFLRIGFSPGSLIIYIILWLVIPEAFTTAEKLEMKGEKVDMNSIKNSVMEEMKGVQQRAEKFSKEAKNFAQDKGKNFSSEVTGVARRGGRSLGDVIALLIKIFVYFILGCVGFAVVVALFAFGIAALGLFPMKDFVLNEGWQSVFAWGTLVFFIAVPIIGIITWIIRRLAKIKSNRKTMRLTFVGLWFLGLICFVSLITSVARDFRYSNKLNEEEVALVNPATNKLEITSTSPDVKYYRNKWFRLEPFEGLEDDTAYVKNVRVHIIKSPNDSFRVTMLKMACGPDKSTANRLAGLMEFNAIQRDSLLVIDKGIAINRSDKFRNQRIILTVYVPVGKQIRIDRSVGWGHDIHFGGPWNDENDIAFEDLEEGWDVGVDYVMKADGLYTLDGQPANTWDRPRVKIGPDGIDVQDGKTRVMINENGLQVKEDENNYRYDKNNPASTLDSLKLKLQKEEMRMKDSLQKAKENIENQLKKIDDKGKGGTTSVSYILPAYNPMLIMN
jgi:phage shock protein PspC (stress-responsive transcriptional regulator)